MTKGDEMQGQETEAQIPEEEPTQQQIVPFMGDDLAAAMTNNGHIYITLPGICAALGLDITGQLRRIRRTRALNIGLRKIPLKTHGGFQKINCLSIDKVALWLAGIQTAQVSPAFREKIEHYQDELAPVATRVFMQVMGIATPASADPRLAALAEQYDTLMDVATFIREHMEAIATLPGQVAGMSAQLDQAVRLLESLAARQDSAETTLAKVDERTKHLTPAHARTIQEQVSRMVELTRRQSAPLTHTIIYGRIKHRFRAGSYKEVADDQFNAVMAFLQEELRRATDGEAPEQNSLF